MSDVGSALKLILIYAGLQVTFLLAGYVSVSITKDDGWIYVAAFSMAVFHLSFWKGVELVSKMARKHEVKEEYKYSNRPEKEIPTIEHEQDLKARASEELYDD